DYNIAEPLFIQALEIRKKVLGENHPDTIESKNNLGLLYDKKGDYEKAEPLHIQALEIRKKVLGENHPDTASSVINLAGLYERTGDYAKAEPHYIQALEIYSKALGENHPDTVNSLNNLAVFYLNKGDYAKAAKYNKKANEAREGELSINLSIGSEKSKQIYLQKYINETNRSLSLHVQNIPKSLEACRSALTEVLRRKGRSIDAVNQSVEALRKRSSPEDVALLDELSQKNTLLSDLTIQGLGKRSPEEYQALLKSVKEEIEILQYKISERSAEFRTISKPITLDAVQQAIPKDATLVEFASYRPYDAKTRNFGTLRYVVYLLNSEGEPDWVDLGAAESINNLVNELRAKLGDRQTSLNKEVKPLARKLDEMVMQPVRKLLVGKGKRILIAPDGKLNLVPFAALVDENDKFLVESYHISYLTSGRDLLRLQTKIESKQTPIIIGNPDFGEPSDSDLMKENNTIFGKLVFKPLIETEQEARAIKKLFPLANLLVQKQATEEAINNANAPLILHIATHGFFLEEKQKSVDAKEDNRGIIVGSELDNRPSLNIKVENPLLRSGIALAGANLHQDETNQGIFTALKTTTLNLWGTKLVVLSACDTGVGEVKTGDGIYGLRRALVLAGSETQIMSLWAVSNEKTKQLMISYYTKLKKDIGRAEALRQVQLELLANPTTRHPYYWASFIQSGEWANLAGKR
ncbi:MAG: DUF2225 domain-containing protein, partial [Blastocatellia bacterium]